MSPTPTPLSGTVTIHELTDLARAAGGVLGVWAPGGRGPRLLRVGVPSALLHVSADLGHLLYRCDRIAVRQCGRTVALHASTLIAWRVLQVVTATPHLPDLDRLRALLPDFVVSPIGIRVPLGGRSAEEVLAACVTVGVKVAESRVGYDADAH